MKFLSIPSDLDSELEKLNHIDTEINKGTPIYVLIFMEGCNPCNMVRPEWKKLENIFDHNSNDAIIADVNKDILSKYPSKLTIPTSYPTIMSINGIKKEDFHNSNIKDTNKSRNIDNFVEWINKSMTKKLPKRINNNKSKRKRCKQKKKTPNYIKGGKWTKKYKKSINCKRPKGFSQRQYCKYGRK